MQSFPPSVIIFATGFKSKETNLEITIVLLSILTFLKTHHYFYFTTERRRQVHIVEGGFMLQKPIKIHRTPKPKNCRWEPAIWYVWKQLHFTGVQNNLNNADLTLHVLLVIFSTRFIKKNIWLPQEVGQHSVANFANTGKSCHILSFWIVNGVSEHKSCSSTSKLNCAGYVSGPWNSIIYAIKLRSGPWHGFGLRWLISSISS